MNRDRADPRITRLREAIIQELNNVTGLWSTDATTADVRIAQHQLISIAH